MDLNYLRSHWDDLRARLIETLDRFQDDELSFTPYPGAWSVRQLMLHIAHEAYGEFHYGITQTLTEFPAEYSPEDYPTLDAFKALLETVHAPIREYRNGLTDSNLERVITPWGPQYRQIEMIGHLVEHEIHHRGELSLILGLLGREGLNA